MTKFEKNMENFFEVPPKEPQESLPTEANNKPPPVLFDNLEDDLKSDYEKVRENMDELIEKGKEALDDILSIARDSEKARDFEVAATLMKTIVDTNQSIIDLHKKIRDISNYKQSSENNTTIKNALFVGSTSELSKLVKELNMKDVN